MHACVESYIAAACTAKPGIVDGIGLHRCKAIDSRVLIATDHCEAINFWHICIFVIYAYMHAYKGVHMQAYMRKGQR